LTTLNFYAEQIEALAQKLGLDYYSVDFEMAPPSFMLEIASYGLPVRMRHWSFGVRYIHQMIRQTMGHSHIFEVMFPGDPCHAYLVNTNSMAENALVTAHVLGHADFSKNNQLFARHHEMAGGHIVEQAAAHANRIEQAFEKYGVAKVEAVMDAALALEPHVDTNHELHRARYATKLIKPEAAPEAAFQTRFATLPGGSSSSRALPEAPHNLPVPPHPEYDLLWFIANYAPELDEWERDIFLAVREESFYFYPVFACQIMNEGWASYWHARLLREADFLPQELYLSAIKAHSDVVRPIAGEEQTALAVNPYHLGFSMWEHIVEKQGIDEARRICREEDDFGFVRNHLNAEMADKLGLFVYQAKQDGEIKVMSRDLNAVRESIIGNKFNYGSPRIAVTEMKNDGSLVLQHDHSDDGRGLDIERANQVLKYVARVWRRPVTLLTVDGKGQPRELSAAARAH
jgi:stage V sporulation protein R